MKTKKTNTGIWITVICAFALVVYFAALRNGFFATNTGNYQFEVLAASNNASPQANANVSGTWTLSVTVTPMPVISGPGPDAARAAIAAQAAAAAAAGTGGGAGRGAGRGPAGPPTVTIAQDGNKITGTVAGGRGPGTPLQGTVSGSTVTFTVARRLSDGIPRDATYKATVSGDTMSGTIAEPTVDPTQAYTDQFTAKRNAAQ